MTVHNNNAWSSWSNDLSEGYNFINSVTQKASSLQTQLNNLITEYQNSNITLDQFNTQSAPIIAQMNSVINGLSEQYPDISGNQQFSKVVANLNTNWKATLQTFSAQEIPNPSYQPNSNQPPTIPFTTNGDGSITVNYSATLSHDGNSYAHLNGLQNLDWLPNGGEPGDSNDPNSSTWGTVNGVNLCFGQFLHNVDQYGDTSTWCWGDGSDCETVTAYESPRGTMNVSITIPADAISTLGIKINPNTNNLTTFTSNPFGN